MAPQTVGYRIRHSRVAHNVKVAATTEGLCNMDSQLVLKSAEDIVMCVHG